MLGLAQVAFLGLTFGCSSADTSESTGALEDGGTGGTGPDLGPEPVLPAAPATCPQLTTGRVPVLGTEVLMWVGEKQLDHKAPVLFYWHGTGSVAEEIQVFMQPMIDEIVAEGGVVASFTTTLGTGNTTGNNVWYTGDWDSTDVILACATQQLNIDTRRVYAAGCSAGGLQAGSMVLGRASYLAGAMPNSGGGILVPPWDHPTHTPSVMTSHGTFDNDAVIIHFSETSLALDRVVVDRGGFAVDCTHPNGHCNNPPEAVAAQWQFLKDHPYGISTDPYANGLPSTFPDYCVPIAASADQ